MKESPTSAENYRERSLLLVVWLGSLRQQGADTHPFFHVDQAYYPSQGQVNGARGEASEKALLEMGQVIDEGYRVREGILHRLKTEGPMFEPFRGDPENVPQGGDLEADWPMFQGNKHNTGYTTAPGPKTGELAWTFPVGLGWCARPAVEGDRVYVGSPGMHTTSLCLELESGEEIWKSTQVHPLLGIYTYPAMMSTPVILEDRVVLREINSHGGNDGQAKNLVYMEKKTGETLSRTYAGHIDYRTQVAPVAFNGKQMVYPFGIHDIYGSPAICQNLNRLVCADLNNGHRLWDVHVGDVDVLAEPVLTEDRALQGTSEGYLYSLNLEVNPHQRIAWKFKADGSLHTAVTLDRGRVYFGSNGGALYALAGPHRAAADPRFQADDLRGWVAGSLHCLRAGPRYPGRL